MNKLYHVLSKVLGISEDQISDDTSPKNTERWDSFNGLMLVSELENEFNVHFTMDEVLSVKCVKDIKETLQKHGVTL